MILFVGQVIRSQMEREAFQAYDFRQMFAPMAKWVAQIDDASRIPEFVQRAFHTAMSPRPGPVVLVLPEDMLEQFGFVGTTEECVERLEQEQAAGALLHSVNVMEDDSNEFARILEALKG